MSKSKLPKISEAEWSVIDLLWEKGPMRSGDIVHALGQHPKTAKTYIDRLVRKGAVSSRKEGSYYFYHAKIKKSECQAELSKNFLEKVFGGSLMPMLAHFVQNTSLSDQEIEELQQIIDERKKNP